MSSKKSLEIMLTEKRITIREGSSKEDSLIAKQFLAQEASVFAHIRIYTTSKVY